MSTQKYPISSSIFRAVDFPAPDIPVTITKRILKYFFGQVNFNALFGSKYTKVYSLIVVLFILIGSSLKVDLVWALADFFNGLMAVPNLLALLALSGVVAGIARNKKD